MVAAAKFPYDRTLAEGGAARISDETIGGHDCLDDEEYPPNLDGTEMYAAKVNQISRACVALDRVTPIAIVSLEPNAGDMVITHVSAAGNLVTPSTFTVIDHVTGNFGVEWAEGDVPPMSMQPRAFAHVGGHLVSAVRNTATSVEVSMATHAGVDADIAVTVEIW